MEHKTDSTFVVFWKLRFSIWVMACFLAGFKRKLESVSSQYESIWVMPLVVPTSTMASGKACTITKWRRSGGLCGDGRTGVKRENKKSWTTEDILVLQNCAADKKTSFFSIDALTAPTLACLASHLYYATTLCACWVIIPMLWQVKTCDKQYESSFRFFKTWVGSRRQRYRSLFENLFV